MRVYKISIWKQLGYWKEKLASSEAALLIQAAEYITRDTLLATVIGLNLDIKTQPASVIPPPSACVFVLSVS